MASPAAAPASDLERRKKVRIRMRRDLSITPQKYEGRTYYVVKDPVSLRYYRFKEQEHFLINMMNGTHTLDESQKAFEKRFRPERLTLEDLEGFAQQLLTAGLAQNESPQAGKLLYDRRTKRRRSEWMQMLTNILYIKLPLTGVLEWLGRQWPFKWFSEKYGVRFEVDKLLAGMLKYLWWMFTTPFFVASVILWLSAIMLVALHFEAFYAKLPSYHEFFTFKNVALLWVALGAVKIIHEFGHGLSCKAFGGEVHEMGLLFLVFSPCLYCNVSDAWIIPKKWKRIIISFAGIYVELCIAAIATFVWWNTPANPGINNMALCLMIVCSVSTVVFNANPLMRYDGYYMLADWLEIPNLRDRSNRYLQRLVMDHCMGIEVPPEQYMALWRRIMFVIYAVVSWVYRWVITFTILWFMANFLGPKLKVISQMLAVASLVSLVGWPLYRLGKGLHKRGRLPDMKPVRVTVSLIVLFILVLAFFLVPLPVARVRQTVLVQVDPDAITKVYLRHSGILEEVRCRDGEYVEEGIILATFQNIDLERDIDQAEVQTRIQRQRINAYTELKQSRDLSQQDRDELDRRFTQAVAELDKYASQSEALKQIRDQKLILRADRSGIVMSPPKVDEIGKYWEVRDAQQQPRPFCSIAKPKAFRVVMPVVPHDYRLLVDDREELRKQGKDLGVTIRIRGRENQTWQGEVAELPQSAAKEVPVQLTTRSGGPLAIKPGGRPGVFEPQAQQYLVAITIKDADDAISNGAFGQAKIHCQWHSCGWWTWRTFNSLFDLGMEPSDLLPWRWSR